MNLMTYFIQFTSGGMTFSSLSSPSHTTRRFSQWGKFFTLKLLYLRHEGGLTLPLSSYDARLVGVHTGHLHAVLQAATGTTAAHLVAPSRTSASRHLDAGVLLHQKLRGLTQFTAWRHTHTYTHTHSAMLQYLGSSTGRLWTVAVVGRTWHTEVWLTVDFIKAAFPVHLA